MYGPWRAQRGAWQPPDDLCRELTKKHETAFRTTIDDLMDFYKDEKPLGECVLVIEGRSRSEMEAEKRASWEEISIAEHVAMYEQQGNSRKDAMKLAAKIVVFPSGIFIRRFWMEKVLLNDQV